MDIFGESQETPSEIVLNECKKNKIGLFAISLRLTSFYHGFPVFRSSPYVLCELCELCG